MPWLRVPEMTKRAEIEKILIKHGITSRFKTQKIGYSDLLRMDITRVTLLDNPEIKNREELRTELREIGAVLALAIYCSW